MTNAQFRRSILSYVTLTVVFSVPWYVLMAQSGLGGGANGYVTALMWGPACAAIATTWLYKLEWRRLGFVWRDPRAAFQNYLLPVAYVGAAYIIIWSTGMGGFPGPEQVAPLAEKLGWNIAQPALFVALYIPFTGLTLIFVGVAHGLGEELGWRGFLAPILHERLRFTGGAALTGLIWTAWHIPLILFSNYNNGTPAWFALGCFFVMVMSLSFIMAWYRLKSGSVWPAAILHGSHNLYVQAVFTPLTASRGTITAYAIDEFGFMLPLTTAIVAIYFWSRRGEAVAAWKALAPNP